MDSGIEGAGLILPWRRCGDPGFPQGFLQLGDSSPRLLEFLLQRGDPRGGFLELRPQDVVSSARAIFAEGLRVRGLRFSIRGEQVLHVEIAVELLHGPQAEEEVVRVVRLQGGRGAQRHQDGVLAAAVEIPGGDVLLPVGLAMHLDEHVPDAIVLVYGGHGESDSQTPPMAMYLWNGPAAANWTGGFLASASQRPGRWAASSISRSDGLRATSSSGFWSSLSLACSMEMIGPPKPARCSSSALHSWAPSCTRDGSRGSSGRAARLERPLSGCSRPRQSRPFNGCRRPRRTRSNSCPVASDPLLGPGGPPAPPRVSGGAPSRS